MAGPSPKFLSDMGMAFDPSWGVPQAAPMPAPMAAPVTLESAIASANAGRAAPAAPTAPMVPEAPPVSFPQGPNTRAVAPPPTEAGPAPPPAAPGAGPGPEAAPAGPPLGPGALPSDVKFNLARGGGVTTAREAPTRGPRQDAHLMASFEAPAEAATSIDFRNQLQSERAEAMYEAQANEALKRQEAADRVLARRQQQQEQLMLDYQDQVQKLGQMQLNDNRWWDNKSTGDKIGTLVLSFLGGISAHGNGGHNLVYDRVVQEMDNDLAAQKLSYQAGLDQAKGIQNAFGMMMERYGTEDAAMAAARASALDFAAAKANQIHAQYGGTESANARDDLLGKLGAERERTISTGFKFIPAGLQPGKYKMTIRGQEVPGLVSEADAQKYTIEHGVKPAENVDLKMVEGGIQSTLQDRKINAEKDIKAAELAAKHKEHAVVMPNGETVYAPNEAEMKELRDLSASASSIKRLVAEAKGIRSKSTTGIPLEPSARGRLQQIQKDLITNFAVQNKLGAISGPDMDLAVGGTADLFQLGNGVESRLDRLNESAISKVSTRVGTYPGAPAKSSGKMPGTFTAHGDKK